MPLPEFNEQNWKAAGRAAEQALGIVQRLRTQAGTMEGLLHHLDAANARVLRADDPAAVAATLEPALRAVLTSEIPALLALCHEVTAAAGVYTPLLEAIMGTAPAPPEE